MYKALVDAYEADKTILEYYGDTTILKRRRGDDDDQEGPSAGSDRGSKRRREGGEPESVSTPSEPATRSASTSTTGTQSRQMSAKRNKSIHRSDEQRNLYKALVDAYECDKIILDTYGDTVTLKRRRDEDKNEEPFAGSNRGSKRRRAGKEPESTSAPKEKTSKTSRKSTEGSNLTKRLQASVESYQKKLNLTKLDTYRSDLKRKEAYTTYSNPRGFIYQNKDKQNRLMRIDKLHKLRNGTLNDVRTALDDRL
nr:hypothetical protein [Tanacetum cinerariifolium]